MGSIGRKKGKEDGVGGVRRLKIDIGFCFRGFEFWSWRGLGFIEWEELLFSLVVGVVRGWTLLVIVRGLYSLWVLDLSVKLGDFFRIRECLFNWVFFGFGIFVFNLGGWERVELYGWVGWWRFYLNE